MLKVQGKGKLKISLSMVGNKKMRKIKKEWFGEEGEADVVAFPLQEELPDGTYLLGEIVINLDQAKKQARQYQVSLPEEIARLAAHGALHLLGHNDQDEQGRQKMAKIEEEVVRGMN